MTCKWYLCSLRARAGERYCRKHQAAFTRPSPVQVIEPLDRTQRIRPTMGGPLRGCIEQHKQRQK